MKKALRVLAFLLSAAVAALSVTSCGKVSPGGPLITKPCPAGKSTAWCPVKATGFAKDPMAVNVARCEHRPIVRICFTPPTLPDQSPKSIARAFGVGAMRVLENSWNVSQETWIYKMELEEDCAVSRDNPWPERPAIAGNSFPGEDFILEERDEDEDVNEPSAIKKRTGRNANCQGCLEAKCANQLAQCTSPLCACWEASGCNAGAGQCVASCGSLQSDPAAVALSGCRAGNCLIPCSADTGSAPLCAVPDPTSACDPMTGLADGSPCAIYADCASCKCGILDPADETTYCISD